MVENLFVQFHPFYLHTLAGSKSFRHPIHTHGEAIIIATFDILEKHRYFIRDWMKIKNKLSFISSLIHGKKSVVSIGIGSRVS